MNTQETRASLQAVLDELERRSDPRRLLVWIAERMVDLMAAIDDLRAAVSTLQSEAAAENQELATIAQNLSAAEQQITALQAQIASGGGVTEADLESLAAAITQVATAAHNAVANVVTPPAPGPGPVGPTGPAAEAAPEQAARDEREDAS